VIALPCLLVGVLQKHVMFFSCEPDFPHFSTIIYIAVLFSGGFYVHQLPDGFNLQSRCSLVSVEDLAVHSEALYSETRHGSLSLMFCNCSCCLSAACILSSSLHVLNFRRLQSFSV
jgi:hypothetical protein